MELTIEKLVYGGDGLGRIESEGRRKAVFVPLVLPGERVEAKVVEDRPAFARARLERVVEPSPDRTSPPCPYFGECGGCHYQHATYEAQLKFKEQILRETVSRIAKSELPEIQVHASEPLHYRNRTRVKVAASSGGNTKFVIGYYRLSSHDLLPVRECPISSPPINRTLQAIWSMAITRELPVGLNEIEFFDTGDSSVLVEFIVDQKAETPKLIAFAQALQKEAHEVVGVSAISRTALKDDAVAAPELSGGPSKAGLLLAGKPSARYRVKDLDYRVGVDAFFQTNRFLIPKMVDVVTTDATGKLAMDLYAGVGLFTLPLSKHFDRVVAVEASSASVQYLRQNAPPHAKIVEATTEAYVERGGQKPDYIVVDPPRAGLGKKVVDGLIRLSPKQLTYVSCDPSTMARDLTGLLAAGYRITATHLLDMFPQTFHIETILRLAR
ncbi:MAG TPA: 23S rRNA (uracil(1939)-C(5))-methyltransferase RlmD [Terriglobales bacterium]|nr:23S rRNA (uracil(1939)-C(5))-methyltransferase RlmD [Terriglobales bacterium]